MNQHKIEYLKTSSLIPYARNSRTHSDEQIAQVAGSIREFGFTNPVLVDAENGIIAGHGRVLAAGRLKLEQVPCIRLTHLTEVQKRAYVIADNKLALNSGWDDAMLSVEFADLSAAGFDVKLTGMSEEELANLVGVTANEIGMPVLNDGDREPFQQMAFKLHDEQVEQVNAALEVAKRMGAFTDSLNENSNGNALSRICEIFITQNGNS